MSVLYITPHFSWAEAECHDGTEVPLELQPNARRLAMTLEKIRERWGGPLVVISWYRTPEYNHRIHGAPKSRHVQADGADIAPVSRLEVGNLRSLVEEMLRDGELPDLGGFGVYRGWIHVDTRPKPASGHVARWAGKGVGSEA